MLPSAETAEFIAKAEQLAKGRRFIAALMVPVERETIEQLFARPLVAGIILTDVIDMRKFGADSRLGFRDGEDRSAWIFPQERAPVIAVLGERGVVDLRAARTAFVRGVGSFVFVNSSDGTARARSIFRVMFPLVLRGLRESFVWLARTAVTGAPATLPGLLRFLLPPSVGEWQYACYLRRLFRSAKAVPIDSGPRDDTVMLVVGSLGPGGSERQVVNTALMLKREGRYRPIVLCLHLFDATSLFYSGLLQQAGIEIVDLQQVDMHSLGSGDATERLAEMCKSEACSLGYDIANELARLVTMFMNVRPTVVHSFLDETNIKAGLAGVLARVPRIVLSARSVAPDNFAFLQDYMRPGYRALLEERNVVLCNNSNAGAGDYRRWLGNRSLPIKVLRNGVDFDAFARRDAIDLTVRQRLGVPLRALVLGSVMRVSEEKQPELWARTVIEISRHRPDVCFVLIGDGPLRSRIELLVANAGISSRVYVLGRTHEVATVLRSLDMLLLTSRIEGLPNVLIEAQAVGVPVVTTPAGGAGETLDPGLTGLIAPDHSVRVVADTCLRLLEDDEMRERMGRTAPAFVRKHFALERMLEETTGLYEASS